MNQTTLVLRSLRHFWRSWIGVLLGIACAAAVIVGALAVGESVRIELRRQTLDRIGGIDCALIAHERYVRAALAEAIERDLGDGPRVAPLLQLRGIATTATGSARSGIAQIFGVDSRFFALGPDGGSAAPPPPAPGTAHLNARLAAQLGVATGDTVIARVEQPSLMPREVALSTVEDTSVGLRVEVARILDDDAFGRFSLRAGQIPPHNVFVDLQWLANELELPGKANMMLVDANGSDDDIQERADRALRQNLALADAELTIAPLAGSELCELTSARVFIDTEAVEVLTEAHGELIGVLTYFVNALRKGDRVTPYSTVAAVGTLRPDARPVRALQPLTALGPVLSGGGRDNSITLGSWAAADLQARIGDTIEVSFFLLGPDLRLEEAKHNFVVERIVPLEGAAADPSLMPNFPGIADTARCTDWDPGIPVALDRIRDVDESYWEQHRGTPKAFVSLATGVRIWANRFGSLTAIRAPVSSAAAIERTLLERLDPASIGLFFQDIRGPALAAGNPATDFGGLFLGLSFFLVFSALLLTALLFAFSVEQRSSEIGTLLALGFRPRQVRRLLLLQALGIGAFGATLGAVLGLGYSRAVLAGLGSVWSGAVGAAEFELRVSAMTMIGGAAGAVLVAIVAIALALRKVCRRSAVELMRTKSGTVGGAQPLRTRRITNLTVASVAGLTAMAIFAGIDGSSQQAAGAFFGAGALLLVAGIFTCREVLAVLADGFTRPLTSLRTLARRNCGRRAGRSLATITLLASGTFLVAAVHANRLEPPHDTADRSTGTGGFALFGRTALPILRDLTTETGRDAFGLDAELAGVAIVPLRVREGDDASCLNLSKPQQPQLVGVEPEALASRSAFTIHGELTWDELDREVERGVVPAFGDASSVQWTMQKSVGDGFTYRDEAGDEFEVRIIGTLADSVLQGNLIISDRQFRTRFPSSSGHRMLLIDAPPERVDQVQPALTSALEDVGLELTTTASRLAAFQTVQNTYLAIFQVLGGLGLLLGTIGLATVVLRNALERRAELAAARAIGYPAHAIRDLLIFEHGWLLTLGLTTGAFAALLAVAPSGRLEALTPVLIVVAVIAVSGLICVRLAAAAAIRGDLMSALRSE